MFCVVTPNFANLTIEKQLPRGNPNFVKGKPRPAASGRRKGTPNKFTTFKAAIEESFEALGGSEYLINAGKIDPGAYLSFVKSVIPKQMEIDLNVTDIRTKIAIAEKRLASGVKRLPD